MNATNVLRRIVSFGAASAVLGLFAVGAVHAQVVVPGTLATAEGNSNFNVPFSRNETVRFQQVYSASEFTSLAGPVTLTGIAFRPDSVGSTPFSYNLDLRIGLSTTSAGPGALSSTFAANVGSDDTTVFDGVTTISTANTLLAGGTGNVKELDIVINFTTPFEYNPSLGNLLLDVRTDTGAALTRQFDATNQHTSVTTSIFNFPNTSTTGGQTSTALVTRFSVAESAVAAPEPGTVALLGTGLLGMALIALRRRSSQA